MAYGSYHKKCVPVAQLVEYEASNIKVLVLTLVYSVAGVVGLKGGVQDIPSWGEGGGGTVTGLVRLDVGLVWRK